MARIEHQQAVENAYSGRLKKLDDYIEVPTSLFIDKVDVQMPPLPAVAFYEKKDGHYKVIRKSGDPYSPLALSALEVVLIKNDEIDLIKRYAETLILGALGTAVSNAAQAAGEPPMVEKKMDMLRRSAMAVVEDLFENPSKENVDRSLKVVGSFVYVLMKDPKAYMFLARLSSHDPYTLQHSVGTSVNCIILAKKMGFNQEKDLLDVGLAGLLHDIGKVKVKKEIINKEGPLDELEWEEMRQHSGEGFNLVKEYPQLSERTKRAILEHHEDRNGTGYPNGLKLEQTDVFSRVVCICDIFNALTTNRSYSKARTPFEAFQFMREKLAHKVDEDLFKNLVLIYGGSLTT